MKVYKKDWNGRSKQVELSHALEPNSSREGGIAENAQAQASENAAALGRLTELLIDKGVITLEQGCDAMGVYGALSLEP